MHPGLQLQTNQLLEIDLPTASTALWFFRWGNASAFGWCGCHCAQVICAWILVGLLRACGGSPFLIKFICNLLYEGRGLEHMTYTQDARPPRSYVQRNPWTYFFVVLGRGESQPSMFCFNLFDTHTIDIAVLSPKIPGQTEVNLTSENTRT